MTNTTAHDCPDCMAELEMTDDSNPDNVHLKCPNCGEQFRGHRNDHELVIDNRM